MAIRIQKYFSAQLVYFLYKMASCRANISIVIRSSRTDLRNLCLKTVDIVVHEFCFTDSFHARQSVFIQSSLLDLHAR